MRNDKLKAIFILWGLILVIELFWIGLLTNRSHSISEVIFVFSVIFVTSAVGAVGMYLFKS